MKVFSDVLNELCHYRCVLLQQSKVQRKLRTENIANFDAKETDSIPLGQSSDF